MEQLNRQITIREAYTQASSFLQQKAADQDPARVSEWMLLHLLGWSRTEFFLRWDDPFPENKLSQWQHMLSRKAAGEPVQYILGEQEFYGLTFKVTPDVLIPRPETEVLVEKIMALGHSLWPDGSPLLVDIGTGSGAIPVTISVHCPNWRVNTSDISAPALQEAQKNAELHGVREQIHFYQGDLLEPFIKSKTGIDILVSNPPYIPSSEMSGLQGEVQHFEPSSALDGGEDGLNFYRRLVEQMAHLPYYPHLVGFEVGSGQAQQVKEMLSACKQWRDIEIISDLSGIERHVIGFTPLGAV
jgi:release factor glutamine methyltransferase